jgi:site-specific recombinase XerD
MEEIFKVRRARLRTLHLTQRALRVLVEHLDNLGALPAPQAAVEPTPVEAFLERYRSCLLRERGLGEATVARYFYVAGQFLRFCSGGEGLKLAAVSASAATKFLTAQCAAHSSGWAKAVAVALRCMLRFLHVEGLISAPLAQAVPTPAGWAGASLPKALKPTDLAAVLVSCDRGSGVGRRDYAVLVLLARLGLRAGEVASLRMGDVDWADGEVRVRGKGPRVDVLPLPADVGRAVADYVTQGRPRARGGALFRRAVAPHEGLNPTSVTGIVYRACERAGLPRVGAHRLRHTAATEMLRGGASLAEIAQVLRQHTPAATALYAKVDRQALGTLAQP